MRDTVRTDLESRNRRRASLLPDEFRMIDTRGDITREIKVGPIRHQSRPMPQ
ncbi:hypothetical protein [Bradyrhizobium sp. STM 3557]|uniref:hypothetical protein n=1 Tax=Bradyrhizobium sp. STM 3557 TaxID=578920 RepID=UPI00388E8862